MLVFLFGHFQLPFLPLLLGKPSQRRLCCHLPERTCSWIHSSSATSRAVSTHCTQHHASGPEHWRQKQGSLIISHTYAWHVIYASTATCQDAHAHGYTLLSGTSCDSTQSIPHLASALGQCCRQSSNKWIAQWHNHHVSAYAWPTLLGGRPGTLYDSS